MRKKHELCKLWRGSLRGSHALHTLHNVYYKWDSTRVTPEGHLTCPLAWTGAQQFKNCGEGIPPTYPHHFQGASTVVNPSTPPQPVSSHSGMLCSQRTWSIRCPDFLNGSFCLQSFNHNYLISLPPESHGPIPTTPHHSSAPLIRDWCFRVPRERQPAKT